MIDASPFRGVRMRAEGEAGGTMAHTFTTLHTHVIFSTKDRSPYLDDEIRGRVFAYMGGVVREMRGTAAIVNGVSDHVHMLLQLPAEVCRLSPATFRASRNITGRSRSATNSFPSSGRMGWRSIPSICGSDFLRP
jgi:REP-associated tyrosine transposase